MSGDPENWYEDSLNRSKDKSEEFSDEEMKTWGFTEKSRKDQQKKDEKDNPSTGDRKKGFLR